MSNIDEVIDPDLNLEALAEAQKKDIKEETTILELLIKNDYGNPIKIKVRYMPQSIASSLEYDDGTPIKKTARKPVFEFSKWAKSVLPRLNALALKNVQIVNDRDNGELGPRDIKLSLISEGEFKRIVGLCFPGAGDGSTDSEDEDSENSGKAGKGVRHRKSSPDGA